MELRLIVLFLCAVCCVTEAQLPAPTALTTSITRIGCGTTKLCVSSSSNCDPSGNSSCYFSSTQFSNGVLTVELSGTTSGYVGLGLTGANSQVQALIQGATGVGPSVVFVCANDNSTVNGSFFFQPSTQNGTQLNAASINASQVNISSIQGSVTANQTVVQCVFKATISSSFTSLPFNVTILNGPTNGIQLGNASTVVNFGTLDLTDPKNNIPKSLNITRSGCGSSKLCFSSGSTCDLAGPSSCFFGSSRLVNQNLLFELSGTTSGYVALGLTKAGSTVVFACGNINNIFFLQPASQNGTSLTPANVNTVYSSQGEVTQKQTLIQCIFNTSTTFNITTKSSDTTYIVTLLSGTTNGTTLGSANVQYNSTKAIDLSDPNALNPNSATSVCVNVVTALLSVLTLWLL